MSVRVAGMIPVPTEQRRLKLQEDLALKVCNLARGDFLTFVQWNMREFIISEIHRKISEKLMALERGDIKRLMIFMPPRSGKTQLATVFFPAWCLGRHPSWQILAVSHSTDYIETKGAEIRDVIKSAAYSLVFPETTIRRDQHAARRWVTSRKGVFNAAGVGSGIAGKGAHLAIIDDPISEQDAYSKVKRETVNDWYQGFRVRLQPGARIILIMTRWHHNDLAGHLLKIAEENPTADQWEVLSIPGELDEAAAKLLNSKKGESCFPEFWPIEELLATKASVTPSFWAAQYLQQPSIEEGGIIKTKWWQEWDYVDPPDCHYILQSLDTAYSSKQTASYSVITTMGVFRDAEGVNNVCILGCKRGHWEYPDLKDRVMRSYEQHQPDVVLVESRASGQSLLQDMNYTGIPFVDYMPDRDKVSRAHVVSDIFRWKKVWIPKINTKTGQPLKWADDVIEECVVEGTLIITNRGVKPVQDLEPGDEVLTHRGRFRPILNLSKRQTTELCRVEAKSLDPLVLTPEHPVYAAKLSKLRGLEGVDWVSAKDVIARKYRNVVRKGKEVREAYPSQCHACTLPVVKAERLRKTLDLRDWLSLPSGKKYRIVEDDARVATTHGTIKAIKWEQPLDHAFGRIIGLFLAEGSSNRYQATWSFNHKTEQDLVDEVTSFARIRLGISTSISNRGSVTNVNINAPILERFFDEFGHGAPNKRIPQWVWEAPKSFITGIISGYADGDGYRAPNGIVDCTTVSPSLAWGIRLLGLMIGQPMTVLSARKAGKATIAGRTCKTKKTYKILWREKRYNNGATLTTKELAMHSVMKKSNIQTKNPVYVYNMDVLEDNSYCTTGGIVHNCAQFPNGEYDDIVDTITQGLDWLRKSGQLSRPGDTVMEEDVWKKSKDWKPRRRFYY